MNPVFETIGRYRVIPVVVSLDRLSTILPLCDALAEGGLPIVEITMRTVDGEEAIRLVTKERPDMIVGAGTVLTLEQARRALAAGARFLVSPGLDPVIVQFSNETGVPITPGMITPSEVQTALRLGVEVGKFFPATTMGGAGTLKYMHGPYPAMKFIPTGGISRDNMGQYLTLPNVLACGGTWMFGQERIDKPDFAKITQLTRETLAAAAGYPSAERVEV